MTIRLIVQMKVASTSYVATLLFKILYEDQELRPMHNFRCSNGVEIRSSSGPQIDTITRDIIYLRGGNRQADSMVSSYNDVDILRCYQYKELITKSLQLLVKEFRWNHFDDNENIRVLVTHSPYNIVFED